MCLFFSSSWLFPSAVKGRHSFAYKAELWVTFGNGVNKWKLLKWLERWFEEINAKYKLSLNEAAFQNNSDKIPNLMRLELWMASHFAPLLVVWSPWVNGFTLSCFFPCVLALPFICFPSEHVNFYFIFFHILHRITLEIMTLQPKCEDVETAEGVAITVTGVAQVNHHTFPGMPVQTPLTYPTLPPPPLLSLASPHNHSRGDVSYRGLKWWRILVFYFVIQLYIHMLGQNIVCMIIPHIWAKYI